MKYSLWLAVAFVFGLIIGELHQSRLTDEALDQTDRALLQTKECLDILREFEEGGR